MRMERVKGRLERLDKQIADLKGQASQERAWSDKRQRFEAAIKRLEGEKAMLEEMLNENDKAK